jgi:hypothetical protein
MYKKVLGIENINEDLQQLCERYGGILTCLERLVSIAKA